MNQAAPLPGLKLVSQSMLEWAGPCPFTGQGDDRWHIWTGKNWWWCRKECSNCPGEPGQTGGRWGWLDKLGIEITAAVSPTPVSPPTLDDARKAAEQIDAQVYEYLSSRGIRPPTARTYAIGKDIRSGRMTIPNIITQSPAHCVGIKKRWVGDPPEPWIPKYTSVPGTKGASIFNWNRLVSQKHWPFFLIVEGVLDTILLDQLGIPAVSPFGGGGVWSSKWARWFARVRKLLIVADRDPPGDDDPEPGKTKALRKQALLQHPDSRIVYPPEGKDVGESYQLGVSLHSWVKATLG